MVCHLAGVLQRDTLAPYLFIICRDYVLRTSIDKIKENGFELTKKRSRRYPAKTITDADYADDITILANTPDQAETLLHSLERAAPGIGFYVNAHKTEYMCFNQSGDISTLDGTPLKLVDKFTYLGSSVESTEKDIDTMNKSWRQHPTRHQLFGHLPPITKTIQVRRARHAGHCWRSRDELIRDVLLWTPTHGRAKAGRPARTYIQQLCEDTGCCPEDQPRAMNDREEWRERVRDIRATSVTWWWWWTGKTLSSREKVPCKAVSKESHADGFVEHERIHDYWFSPCTHQKRKKKSATLNSAFYCHCLRQNSPYLLNDTSCGITCLNIFFQIFIGLHSNHNW